MYVYFQYIIITGLIAIWTKKNIERKNVHTIRFGGLKLNLSWFAEWLFFTLLAACRLVDGTVGGADSENYVYAFLNSRVESSEFLFYRLNDFILLFTQNYHIYFFIIYGIIVFGLLYFAAYAFKQSTNLIVLLFYFNIYVTSFGVMRQWLGVAVGLIAVVLAAKKRYYSSIIMVLISVGFHFTMLVYLGLLLSYFAVGKKIKKFSNRFLLFSALACNVFFIVIRNQFINILSGTEYKAYVSPELLKDVSWLGYLPTIFFLIICFLYMRRYDLSDELSNITRFFLFAHLGLIFATVALGMFRFQLLFMPCRAFAMCKVRDSLKNKLIIGGKNSNLVAVGFDVVLLLDAVLYMWRTIGNGALPYVFNISSSFNHIPYYIK